MVAKMHMKNEDEGFLDIHIWEWSYLSTKMICETTIGIEDGKVCTTDVANTKFLVT